MNLLKRLSALLLIFALLCSTVLAAEPPANAQAGGRMIWPGDIGGEPPTSEPIQITGLLPVAMGNTSYQLLTLTPGTPLSALKTNENRQLALSCATNSIGFDGKPMSYWCPVEWDFSDTTDTSTPGRVTVEGTLQPESDYLLAGGVSSEVTTTVLVIGERPDGQSELLQQAFVNSLPPALLPVGEAPEAYFTRSIDATCLTANAGEFFSHPIQWDFTTVKQDIPGTYPITGTLELPAGLALPPDFKPFPRSIVVMDATKVDLSNAVFEPETRLLGCNWLYQVPKETPVRLEYAIGTEAWTLDDQCYLHYNPQHGRSLSVHLEELEVKTDYYFRILYGAEEQQQISNVLHVRLESKDFSESAPPDFDIGGDRDGGDHEGTPLPPLEQPAPDDTTGSILEEEPVPQPLPEPAPLPAQPQPVPEPAPAPAPPTELVTDTTTILSGLRLADLTAERSTVLFEKQGVAIELSSSFLAALALTEQQLLEVTIRRPTADTFSLALYANGKAVEELPTATVRLPWSSTNQPLECVDLAGTYISDAHYEPAGGTVSCTIPAAGAYRIRATAPPEAPAATITEPPAPAATPPAPHFMLTPAVVVALVLSGLLLGAALWLLVRRWLHG